MAWPRPGGLIRIDRSAVAALLGALVWLAGIGPAHAQASGTIAVASDDRWRGRSLSAGRPVAAATIGYDAPDGLYVDGTATIAAMRQGPVLTGIAADAGYAWRTRSALSIDIGVTRRQFTHQFSGNRATGYSEIYAGVGGRSVSARLSYSPDYFSAGFHTLYASIDGVHRLDRHWRLTAHGGGTFYLSPIRTSTLRSFEYDASIGIARRSGPIDLRLDLSFGGPDEDYYRGQAHSKTALVASAAFAF